jgi:hypothetical protein
MLIKLCTLLLKEVKDDIKEEIAVEPGLAEKMLKGALLLDPVNEIPEDEPDDFDAAEVFVEVGGNDQARVGDHELTEFEDHWPVAGLGLAQPLDQGPLDHPEDLAGHLDRVLPQITFVFCHTEPEKG